ncbi:hypothetical protein PAHAL_3G128600 [Panicum hallii]|uniref:Uncharacterized protein n=1 Tax=Panicum hallii TaxID=206008 RepID=A0A2T8KI16_9POAL|nr:hypothetical protein PAHAL_3G128600 [Panicum hallii]
MRSSSAAKQQVQGPGDGRPLLQRPDPPHPPRRRAAPAAAAPQGRRGARSRRGGGGGGGGGGIDTVAAPCAGRRGPCPRTHALEEFASSSASGVGAGERARCRRGAGGRGDPRHFALVLVLIHRVLRVVAVVLVLHVVTRDRAAAALPCSWSSALLSPAGLGRREVRDDGWTPAVIRNGGSRE